MEICSRMLRILTAVTIVVFAIAPLQATAETKDVNTMTADPEVAQAIYKKLQRMSTGLVNRNADEIVDLFAPSPDVLVIGSKAGKIARGVDEARAMFEGIVSASAATRLVWKSYTVHAHGDVAWVFALVELVHERPAGVTRVPYRVTSVFARVDGHWQWLQYHGSEPIVQLNR